MNKNLFKVFHEQVQQKADIIQAVGESICNILEVQCLTPR